MKKYITGSHICDYKTGINQVKAKLATIGYSNMLQSTPINQNPFNRTPLPSETNCEGMEFLHCNVGYCRPVFPKSAKMCEIFSGIFALKFCEFRRFCFPPKTVDSRSSRCLALVCRTNRGENLQNSDEGFYGNQI